MALITAAARDCNLSGYDLLLQADFLRYSIFYKRVFGQQSHAPLQDKEIDESTLIWLLGGEHCYNWFVSLILLNLCFIFSCLNCRH